MRAKSAQGRRWSRALWRLAPKSRRGFAGVGLAAMMIGIVVNAIALQNGRRLELPPLPPPVADVRPPAPIAIAKAPSAEEAAPTPRLRPGPTTVALAHVGKPADPIGDFLLTNAAERRRMVASAQTALVKLGYPVKTTGALDSQTRDALVEYEKAHRLTVSTEIKAKLVKTLSAAAAAN